MRCEAYHQSKGFCMRDGHDCKYPCPYGYKRPWTRKDRILCLLFFVTWFLVALVGLLLVVL